MGKKNNIFGTAKRGANKPFTGKSNAKAAIEAAEANNKGGKNFHKQETSVKGVAPVQKAWEDMTPQEQQAKKHQDWLRKNGAQVLTDNNGKTAVVAGAEAAERAAVWALVLPTQEQEALQARLREQVAKEEAAKAADEAKSLQEEAKKLLQVTRDINIISQTSEEADKGLAEALLLLGSAGAFLRAKADEAKAQTKEATDALKKAKEEAAKVAEENANKEAEEAEKATKEADKALLEATEALHAAKAEEVKIVKDLTARAAELAAQQAELKAKIAKSRAEYSEKLASGYASLEAGLKKKLDKEVKLRQAFEELTLAEANALKEAEDALWITNPDTGVVTRAVATADGGIQNVQTSFDWKLCAGLFKTAKALLHGEQMIKSAIGSFQGIADKLRMTIPATIRTREALDEALSIYEAQEALFHKWEGIYWTPEEGTGEKTPNEPWLAQMEEAGLPFKKFISEEFEENWVRFKGNNPRSIKLFRELLAKARNLDALANKGIPQGLVWWFNRTIDELNEAWDRIKKAKATVEAEEAKKEAKARRMAPLKDAKAKAKAWEAMSEEDKAKFQAEVEAEEVAKTDAYLKRADNIFEF